MRLIIRLVSCDTCQNSSRLPSVPSHPSGRDRVCVRLATGFSGQPLTSSPSAERIEQPNPKDCASLTPSMPTPSSNAPDPESHSSRSYPFSSCPDPDEHSLQPQPPSNQPSQIEADSPSETQSSWTAGRDPTAYTTDAEIETPANHQDDAIRSRSITMSPGPQTDGTFDIDMGREPDGMVISQDHIDENHKQTEEDEEMLAVDTQHSNSESTNEGDADVNTTPTAAASSASTHSASNRRRGKAPDVVSSTGVGELDEMDMGESTGSFPRWVEDSGLVGMGYEYMHRRIIPTSPSSYLRPGSRFTGTQQSERQRYDVQVEIKYVDMRESFLCGYLRIQGLLMHLEPFDIVIFAFPPNLKNSRSHGRSSNSDNLL